MSAVELARVGKNLRCIVCSDVPLFGGLRCLPCFQRRCVENAGSHVVPGPASAVGYARGCRCAGCRRGAAIARKALRKKAAA